MKALAARYESERMPSRRSTARVYRSWLNNYILPQWGESFITEVHPRPVELWLRGLDLSSKSKSHIRNLLHVLLDFAMWAGVLELSRNPIDLVVVKGATKRTRQLRSLTVEQFQKLIEQLREPFGTMAMVCVCFGLRVSECLALRWSDVDWLNGNLRVERGIVEQNVDDVKTDGSRKSLTVANELLDRLNTWRHTTEFLSDGDWIFASPMKLGRLPYSYTGFWRELAEGRKGGRCWQARDSHVPTYVPELVGRRGNADCSAAEAHAALGHSHNAEHLRRRGDQRNVRSQFQGCGSSVQETSLMDCTRIADCRKPLKEWLLR